MTSLLLHQEGLDNILLNEAWGKALVRGIISIF